jgi:hypothetical protein
MATYGYEYTNPVPKGANVRPLRLLLVNRALGICQSDTTVLARDNWRPDMKHGMGKANVVKRK